MVMNVSRVALQAVLVAAVGPLFKNNGGSSSIMMVQAMQPNPNEYTIHNADGSTFVAHMSGTEQDPVEEDADGFAVLPKEDDSTQEITYEFAEVDESSGDLKQTGIRATDPDGHNKMRQRGVKPGARRSAAAHASMGMGGGGSRFAPKGRRSGDGGGGRGRTGRGNDTGDTGTTGLRAGNRDLENIEKTFTSPTPALPTRRLSHIDEYEHWDESVEDFHRRQLALDWSGTKKNLVIPMRFSDHATRWLPTQPELDILFNSDTPDDTFAPTGSIKQVFKDTSYGKLTLDSDVVDWITLDETEAYYADGARGFTPMMHQAMRNALDKLEATGFDFSPYDSDVDGLIDSICFLHSGYAAEWGGTDEDGGSYLNRIWSHKWSMYSFRHPSTASRSGWTSNASNSANGKSVRVYNYHISPAVYGTYPSSKNTIKEKMGRIGVIAHETGHFLGITDLYDTQGDGGSGIGSWGLMANSWGFHNDQYYPPTMNPWSKMKLGWLNPIELSTSGTYSLSPSYDTEQVYKISTGFAADEYLLVEYRNAMGFDRFIGNGMANGGLAIWHIDNKAGYNHQGWPGQTGWPQNGKHYRVALLAADGKYELEKNMDRGDAGDLFVPGAVDRLTTSGTGGSSANAYPNTDSYQGGNIVSTGIDITNIRFADDNNGAKMAFDIAFPVAVTESPTPSPTESPTSAPSESPTRTQTASPTKSPTSSPTSAPTKSPTTSPTESPTKSPTSAPTNLPTASQTKSTTSSPTSAPTNPSTLTQTASPNASPTGAPTGTHTESPTRPPTVPEVTCVGAERLFSLVLDVPASTAASNVSWMIEDVAKSQTRIVSPVYVNATVYKHEYCLTIDGCYKFVLKQDASTSGAGVSFTATYDGELVVEGSAAAPASVSGGDFGSICRLGGAVGRQTSNIGRVGTATANGIMFDVQAKEGHDLVFFRLAGLRLAAGTHTLEVFTKSGSYQGYEANADVWTLAQTLTGIKGGGIVTFQPQNFAIKVPVLSETTQAFYVLISSGGSNLVYNDSPAVAGTAAGEVWKSTERYNVLAGEACTSSNAFEGCGNSGLVAGYEGYVSTGIVAVYSTFAPTPAPGIDKDNRADATVAPTPAATSAPTKAAASSPTSKAATSAPTKAATAFSGLPFKAELASSWTVIDFNNFESRKWGEWKDGGIDARLNRDAAYAKSGEIAVRLRDNTSTSVMTHNPMDVSDYTKLKVSFSFYAKSMELGEDFWLQVDEAGNGTNWVTVAKWVSGKDFSNGSFYDDVVEFTPVNDMTSNTNLRLRFRCDANRNSDFVYIDDVEISGYGSN
jgi:M6 family metalloprotease-like protein